ncbi:MAG: holo-ACP synthase [Phycisphaeraceae bacterium]
MSILAHGIDLVEIQRITDMMQRHGDRFLSRCFTAAEQAYAMESAKRRDERLAARFAAKEAGLKAIGTGWRDGIAWTDVEVTRLPSGQPQLKLHNRAREVAESLGVTRLLVSLSHTDDHAIASVIAIGREASS